MSGKIKIEKGIDVPDCRWATEGEFFELREVLRKMKVGESFRWHNSQNVYRAARQLNVKVISRKLNGSGYRIWKVKGK